MIKNTDADKKLIDAYVANLNINRQMDDKPPDLMTIENVQQMMFDAMMMSSGNGYMLPGDLTQEYVNKFIEEWRRNNDC